MLLLLKQALSVMRVLVVDDERNIRQTMGTALESMDHEAVTVSTGEEALRRLGACAKRSVKSCLTRAKRPRTLSRVAEGMRDRLR